MNIFNEGLIDTELFWLSFGDVISNIVISTVIIAEIGFIIWLLLKWLRGNIKLNWSPVLNIGESARRRSDSPIEASVKEKVYKDMGAVEVDINKNIFIDKADAIDIKSDKVKKGKVKTQKNKLKKLIGSK